MSITRSITILLSAIALAACSDESTESTTGAKAGGPVQQVSLYAAEGAEDISVLAFREHSGGQFLYDQTVAGTWQQTDENVYQATADLYLGSYKFLFAKGFGDNLAISPALGRDETAYESLRFALSVVDQSQQYYGSADELFLGRPDEHGRVYDLEGPQITGPTVIADTLKRVVSRLDLQLLRGSIVDGTGVPEPFEDPSALNVLSDIDSVAMVITGPGSELYWNVDRVDGNTGKSVFHKFYPDADQIDPDTGFAAIRGPFLLPAGTTLDVAVTATVYFTQDSGRTEPVVVSLPSGRIAPNKLTVVRLYIAPEAPNEILIEAVLTEMSDETDGDTGLWN